MDRMDILHFAREEFGSEPEYLWAKYPDYCVLRHTSNQKWYAVIMNVSKRKLGLIEDEVIDILDVKCDPILLGSLLGRKGFLPAYHMSKSSWVSIVLDGSVPPEEIRDLLTVSYDLTKKKK